MPARPTLVRLVLALIARSEIVSLTREQVLEDGAEALESWHPGR